MICIKCDAFTFKSKFLLFFNSLFFIRSSFFASNPSLDLEPYPCFVFTLTCAKGVVFTFKSKFLLFFNFLFFIKSSLCAFDPNPNLDLEPCSISTLTCTEGVVSTVSFEFPLRCCSSPCSTCKHFNKITFRTRSSRKNYNSSSMCFGREDILVKNII